jgi:predicted nuclease of predicted toxin-antitoxin system
LADLYPGSEQVLTSGLGGARDGAVWNYAALHGLTIVSKDSDFFHRTRNVVAPPRVIWLRLGNSSTDDVERLLRSNHRTILEFLDRSQNTCLELEAT